MSDRIVKLLEDELQSARGRVTFLTHALNEAQLLPDLKVEQLRNALRAHCLAVVDSDALRVALDRFDLADKVEDGLEGYADVADVHAARAAIYEAWRASK